MQVADLEHCVKILKHCQNTPGFSKASTDGKVTLCSQLNIGVLLVFNPKLHLLLESWKGMQGFGVAKIAIVHTGFGSSLSRFLKRKSRLHSAAGTKSRLPSEDDSIRRTWWHCLGRRGLCGRRSPSVAMSLVDARRVSPPRPSTHADSSVANSSHHGTHRPSRISIATPVRL